MVNGRPMPVCWQRIVDCGGTFGVRLDAQQGRICDVPVNTDLPVQTAWTRLNPAWRSSQLVNEAEKNCSVVERLGRELNRRFFLCWPRLGLLCIGFLANASGVTRRQLAVF